MFSINDLNISITRGDTASIEITFEGDIPTDGDLVVMSLKRTTSIKTPIWEKTGECEDGTIIFNISSDDTKDLPFGTYAWDIRIFYKDGQVTSPFKPKDFKVMEVVTNNDREP